jgi:hypothetical protein
MKPKGPTSTVSSRVGAGARVAPQLVAAVNRSADRPTHSISRNQSRSGTVAVERQPPPRARLAVLTLAALDGTVRCPDDGPRLDGTAGHGRADEAAACRRVVEHHAAGRHGADERVRPMLATLVRLGALQVRPDVRAVSDLAPETLG